MKSLVFCLIVTLLTLSANASDIPMLITNTDKKIYHGDYNNYIKKDEGNISREPIKNDVYDLSFVAYDKEFAEEFGLVEDEITQMDKGLRFVEIRMITEGRKTNCYYNVILDKNIEVDFPKENYYKNYMNPSLNLPADKNAPKESQKKRINLYTHNNWGNASRYYRRIHLGNRKYKFNISGKPFSDGSTFDVTTAYYIQDREINYNIISTQRGCGGGSIYRYPEPAFWILKKDMKNPTVLPQIKNFHTFEIPRTIVDKFTPHLFKFENENYRKSIN